MRTASAPSRIRSVAYTAVDCQGFAGGFTLGVVQAGFTLTAKKEMKGAFGATNCERNRHLLGDSWRTEVGTGDMWSVPHGGADLVFGNPPCSAWSVMSSKTFRGAESKILGCTWAFVDYAARVRPQVAVFESVPQAITREDGRELMRHLRAHLEEKTDLRYDLHHVRHNALALGGPAHRPRYFWVASQVPFGVEPVELDRLPVLDDVIGDLAYLPETWQAQPYRAPATWWSARLRSPDDVVDGHVSLDTPLTRRVLDLARGVTWNPRESISTVARRYHETHGRLPGSWAATAGKVVAQDFALGFTTPTRWDGDRHARVVTGGSLVMVVHPHLDRMITHREAARVLGFPDDWHVLPLRGASGLHMTWGKGITVDCGRWVGTWVRHALDGEPGGLRGTPCGDREWEVDLTRPRVITPRTSVRSVTGMVELHRRHSDTPRETDHMTEAVPEAETAAAAEPTPSARGRTRPSETLDRDEAGHAKLAEAGEAGLTRDELADKLGVKSSQAYLVIYRLKSAGRVARATGGGPGHRWVAVGDAGAQAPAEPEPEPVSG